MNEQQLDLMSLIPRVARIETAVTTLADDFEIIKQLNYLHSSDLTEIKARLAQLANLG